MGDFEDSEPARGWASAARSRSLRAAAMSVERTRIDYRNAEAKQQRIEARRGSLKSRRSRRKILVGAIVLAKVEQGVLEESVLRDWLKGALTRPDDRALFGL